MKELPPAGSTLRHAIEAINSLVRGRSNAVQRVTLTASATETVVTSGNLNESAEVFLTPRTANAAAALATTYAYVERIGGNLQVTIKHASSGTTDRTFGVIVIGG